MKLRIYYNGYDDNFYIQYKSWLGWRDLRDKNKYTYVSEFFYAKFKFRNLEEALKEFGEQERRILKEREQKQEKKANREFVKKRALKSGVIFEKEI